MAKPSQKSQAAPKAKHQAQAAYNAEQRALGNHIKLTAELKTDDDVSNYRGLVKRFPDLSNAALVKLALRELGAKKNRR